jgi:hypothetical protein
MAGTAQQARRMAYELPLGRDAAAVQQRIEAAEKLLERLFTVPGSRSAWTCCSTWYRWLAT